MLSALACSGKSPQRAAAAADTAHPGGPPGATVDSILPMAEYLRRFRSGLSETSRLEGGTLDRETLARQFLAGVAGQDTAALIRLVVSPAEFAWLLFPQHKYSEPPHELDPALFWSRLDAESEKGLRSVLQRYGGHTLGFRELRCQRDTLQLRAGPATLWSSCQVSFRNEGKVERRRLFGSMVERDGRVKLLSLANEF
ncbi:MAG TPA: hypothetical protein VL241_04070 [Gemmatimonadales bacterium]|nr:hypothetical protein [Gemmatimonadales bacterium]